MTPRLSGIITNKEAASGVGIETSIHEFIHGVSGYEYGFAADQTRGDGMHPPAMVDYSALAGPIWDWELGFPDGVKQSNGEDGWGVKIFPNDDCKSCSDDQLTECCTFHYEDYPETYDRLMANPFKKMSPLLLYIAGMIKRSDLPNDDYYMIGSDMGMYKNWTLAVSISNHV